MSAGPGFPWNRWGTTTREVIERLGVDMIADHVVARALGLLEFDPTSPEPPEWWMSLGLTDPIRLFVKNEPHSRKKLLEQRYRLISSVSLGTKILEIILYGDQNNAEVDLWNTLPSFPGLGLDDESAEQLYERLLSSNSRFAISSDVSGWDQSVPYWLLAIDTRMRVELSGSGFGKPWARLLANHCCLTARAIFSLSDGSLYRQTIPGMMKSGTQITASANSRMRSFLATLVSLELGADLKDVFSMGDDCVELYNSPPDEAAYVLCYKKYGFKITDFWVGDPSGIEFCSHHWADAKPVPVSPWKQLYALLSNRVDQKEIGCQVLSSFLHNLRHHPDQREFLQIIAKSGWGLAIDLEEEEFWSFCNEHSKEGEKDWESQEES